MFPRHTSLNLFLSAIILSGCASSEKTYPSLAIRDAERVQGSMASPAAPPAPAPVTAQLLGQVAQLQSEARASHTAFMAAAPPARRAAQRARGSAIASDAWGTAQVALGDLDSIRSRTAVFLGDLDLLYVDATLSFEQREEIGIARQNVVTMVAEEDEVLANLRGLLRS